MLRYVWLVATREYAENAKTKGFWIGILIFPLLLMVSMKLPKFLEEKALPTRYYAVSDKSGRFEKVIDRAVAADYQRKENEAIKIHDARILTAYEESAGSQEKALAKAIGAEPARAIAAELKSAAAKMAQQFGGGENGDTVNAAYDAFSKLSPEERGSKMALALRLQLAGLESFKKLDPKDQEKALAEIDKWAKPAFVEGGKKAGPYVPPRRRSKHVTELPKDFDPATPSTFRPYLSGEKKIVVDGEPSELFAYIVIPAEAANWEEGSRLPGIDYWCTNLTDNNLKDMVEESITNDIKQAAYEKRSVSKADLDLIQKTEVALKGKDPKKAEGEEEVKREDTMRQWAPVAAVYLLWVAIFTVAQMLLNNTTEEKTNRVIEVLLSSVTPTELMFGKLVGIAGVGLTMVGAWIGSFLLLLNYASGLEAHLARALMETVATPQLLAAFAGYFILGYLLYAGVFLAIGSMVSSLKEAQNMMGPIMVIMMVPLLTMVFIARDPNGALAVVLSWIPPYTPFVMMNRAAASPPAFDVYGTLVLLVISVAVSIWLSGRIFRIGILRTGQPPKLMELVTWLRRK